MSLIKKFVFGSFLIGLCVLLLSYSLLTGFFVFEISESSIEISDCVGLQNIKNNLSADYILLNDIDCSLETNEGGILWNDGLGFEPIIGFLGSFDGQGNKISGVYINRSSSYGVGLFGELGDWSGKKIPSIVNLSLNNFIVVGDDYTGSLVGSASDFSILDNINVSNSLVVSGGNDMMYATGGIIGGGSYNISNSNVFNNVTILCGESGCGGIAGERYEGGIILNCNVYDNIKIIPFNDSIIVGQVGGLIGGNWAGSIINSHVYGGVLIQVSNSVVGSDLDIVSTYRYNSIGGLVGQFDNTYSSDLSNNFIQFSSVRDNVTIIGVNNTGGLVGVVRDINMSNSYVGPNVSVMNYLNSSSRGGFIGFVEDKRSSTFYNSSISNSYSAARVLPLDGENGGGFIGMILSGDDYEDSGNLWDTENSEFLVTSGNANGKNSSEMKDIQAYINENWNISSFDDYNNEIWKIKTDSYPILGFQDYLSESDSFLLFITIPEDESIVYGDTWQGVQFEVESTLDFSYSVNDTEKFFINETGFLSFNDTLNVGNYHILILVDDGSLVNSTLYNLNITKKEIEVKADNKVKYYGEDDPILTFVITEGDLVSGDELNLSLIRDSGEEVGTYTIAYNESSSENINYNITFINSTFEILSLRSSFSSGSLSPVDTTSKELETLTLNLMNKDSPEILVTKEFSEGNRIPIKIKNANHTLNIDNVGNSEVTITIFSNPKTRTLNIGEEWKADLTDDNYYDLYVKLNSVIDNKANISMKAIYEPVLNDPSDSLESPVNKGNSLKLIDFIIFIFIIFCLLYVLLRIKKKI
jgi:hypothetical protein